MTRSPSSKGSSSSYQVSSPQYRDRGGSYPPNQYYYPNGSRPPKYEMSEFTANTYMTNNGHKNGNSRVGPMPTNGHKMSSVPPEEEDEELDRGHWGSKAEFILSCIGFSVCFHCLLL